MEEISIGEFARRSRLSLKALRLYDELGVLIPARVDVSSGYRYYDAAQLESARLIAMLRQLDFPLVAIKEMLERDRAQMAELVAARWRDVEVAHCAKRTLADFLINQPFGKEHIMNVATRDMPERRLLCLKRHVDEPGAWALGKEFISIFKERPLPKFAGREGAMYCSFWGEVSADSDGPIEMCKPIPEADAEALAAQYPELIMRTEPAHREAFVALSADRNGVDPAQVQLASAALHVWAIENHLDPENLTLKPEDLGVRMTYLAREPVTETSVPDCDFAVAFA
jgi:DNA-binding transcriptional MerR regulator